VYLTDIGFYMYINYTLEKTKAVFFIIVKNNKMKFKYLYYTIIVKSIASNLLFIFTVRKITRSKIPELLLYKLCWYL